MKRHTPTHRQPGIFYHQISKVTPTNRCTVRQQHKHAINSQCVIRYTYATYATKKVKCLQRNYQATIFNMVLCDRGMEVNFIKKYVLVKDQNNKMFLTGIQKKPHYGSSQLLGEN